MNVSVNWLSAILGRDIDAHDAANRLSLQAVPVDGVESVHTDLDDVIVGYVESVDVHPNADKLVLCQVNNGSDVVEVVCGAPNVRAGRKYPFAPTGAVLPGGLKLEARKIRGVVSNGMLLSEREMGMGTDQAGIMELVTDAAPGTKLVKAAPLTDQRLALDVTPNRPDLLCHKGVARELAASYDATVKLEPIPGALGDPKQPRRFKDVATVGGVEVSIVDTEGCPRYMAAVIRGVTIQRSPLWVEARLRAVGARPINNVVDATNYVLYELNQPLHAFDLAKIRGHKIIVRRANPNEELKTLDGEVRKLTPEMTMIADGEGATAIAGVMGGADSEVGDETTDILLECAYFDPIRNRATRKALRMSTEASYRFERGTDLHGMPDALERAVTLIRAVAGGSEPEPGIDVYPKPTKSTSVFLRPERVEHLLGVTLPREEMERHLSSVGFVVVPKNGRLAVQVPGWRPDVTREVDLIEEIARLKGFDAFPVELRAFRPSSVPDDPVEPLKASVRRLLTGIGLNEARSLPLVSSGAQEVLNPLSSDESYLRDALVPGLIQAAQRNWSVRERDIRLFEIGTVFEAAPGGRPREHLRVAGVVSGGRAPRHWSNRQVPDYDIWDLKEIFLEVIRLGGVDGRVVERDHGWILLDESGKERGRARSLAADRPEWSATLLGFEADLAARTGVDRLYHELPTTPPVKRDVALILPDGVQSGDVEAAMRKVAGPLLETVQVFDEYRGKDFGRSVAWRLVFRAPDRTLKDREVDKAITRALKQLKEEFGVERRQA